jgi:hypothetical protein
MKKIIKIASLALVMLFATQAFAAVTYTVSEITGPYAVGGKSKQATGKIALSGTYDSNGFTVNPASFGMSHIQQLQVQPIGGYVFHYDSANSKIIAYRQGGLTSAGSVSSSFTGTPATISPTAAFTGDAMGTHQHADTAAFTGSADTITPTAALATDPTFTAGGRASNYVSLVGDATACDNTDNENVDGAEIASADAVAAYSTVAASAWAVGAITAPDYARNVAITIKNDSGGPLNLFEGVMTFTVTGTDWADGALSETITFTSTALNKAVATANYRAKFGVKAFKTVTAVTLDNVPDDGLKIGVGKGGHVSLYGNLKSPAESDVIQVVEDGSVLVLTGNVDTTNMTFDFGTIAGSKVISMLYQTIDGSSGTVSSPAITVTGAAYTPAGSVAITADAVSAGTPSGSIAVTGAAYTPAGSVTSSFTGSAVAAGAMPEVSNGVNVAGITAVNFVAIGW